MDEHILKRLDRIADALEARGGAKEAHVDVKSIRESPLVPVVEKIAEALNKVAENQAEMATLLGQIAERLDGQIDYKQLADVLTNAYPPVANTSHTHT